MQTFIDFLVNNYFWFLIISLILIFALIGYLVDTSERPNKKEEIAKQEKAEETLMIQEITNMVEPTMNNNNIEIENSNIPIPTVETKTTDENIIFDDLDTL